MKSVQGALQVSEVKQERKVFESALWKEELSPDGHQGSAEGRNWPELLHLVHWR